MLQPVDLEEGQPVQPATVASTDPAVDPSNNKKEVVKEDSCHSNTPTEPGGNKGAEKQQQQAEEEAAQAISQLNLQKQQPKSEALESKHHRQHSNSNGHRIGTIYRLTGKGEMIVSKGATGAKTPNPTASIAAANTPKDNKDSPDVERPALGDKMAEEMGDVTWKDVALACCCHSFQEWCYIWMGILSLLGCLYFFLLGLELLGTSFKVVGGCTAGEMLGSNTNPMAALMIGIIATAILQSSSTTTAIIVSLVSGGLDVKTAIYMVFGANVGTSVTCMLVSLGHMSEHEELERAFSSASALYVFNMMTLIVLFPVELATGYLYYFTKLMLPDSVGEGEKWEGPIKKMISPLSNRIIMSNKDLITAVSDGNKTCEMYYPVQCDGGVESAATCNAGLIDCDSKTDKCPVFFQSGASKNDDMVSGWVCLILGLFLLIFCLIGLVALLRKMLLGASTRIIYKATNINPYVAMVIGAAVTIMVQSSSITSSALVPLAGVGILNLEQMLPLIMGADIGTCITAILASMVSSKVEALQIALVHLFFNVTGVLMWYPLPFMRNILLRFCRKLGKTTSKWRNFPIIFIFNMYFIFPLLLLGISTCFEQGSKGFNALGVFLIMLLAGGLLYGWIWWRFRGGRNKFRKWIINRQRRAAAIAALSDDMDYIKVDLEWARNEIGRLKDFAGIATIEDGRAVLNFVPRPPASICIDVDDTDENEWGLPPLSPEEEDKVSLYASCQSKPWQNVLVGAAHSIRSGLGGGGGVGIGSNRSVEGDFNRSMRSSIPGSVPEPTTSSVGH